MSENVVIFDTAIGTGNVGDEIIMQSCIKNMESILCSKGIVLRLGTHTENFSRKQMKKPVFKTECYCNAPYKFIMGTNLLMNFRSPRQTNHHFQLYQYNKAIYLNSVLVGVGTTFHKGLTSFNTYTKKIYKEILSDKYIHSVRDKTAKRLLEEAGVRAVVTGCPTLWEMTEERCGSIPESKCDQVITSVSGQDKYHQPEIDNKMLRILKKNYKKVFVWIQTVKDEEYFDSLSESCDIDKIFSLYQYTELLNNNKLDYVGTRLHGGVYALTHGARTIVVSIDERAEGFNREHNLPIILRKDIPEQLEDRINSSFKTNIKNDWDAINGFKEQFL